MQVEIWSDVVCPWCYLGKRRFENALAEVPFASDVDVVHRSFQLDPSAPHDHTVDTTAHLAEKYGLTGERARQMQQEMEQRAAEDGLEYHLAGQRSGSTLAAHRLLQFAKAQGKQDVLIEVMYRAYFTDGGSVFDTDALEALATQVGLDPAQARDVLTSERYTDAVQADLEQAREYGVNGVPFYVFDGKFAVSGAQTTDVFQRALVQAHDASA